MNNPIKFFTNILNVNRKRLFIYTNNFIKYNIQCNKRLHQLPLTYYFTKIPSRINNFKKFGCYATACGVTFALCDAFSENEQAAVFKAAKYGDLEKVKLYEFIFFLLCEY